MDIVFIFAKNWTSFFKVVKTNPKSYQKCHMFSNRDCQAILFLFWNYLPAKSENVTENICTKYQNAIRDINFFENYLEF